MTWSERTSSSRLVREARCWQLRWRDRVAWWLFRRIAHPDVAGVTWKHYKYALTADRIEWTWDDQGAGRAAGASGWSPVRRRRVKIWRQVKFRLRWCFTHDGARASLLYHDARGGPLPLTRGQAMTLVSGKP